MRDPRDRLRPRGHRDSSPVLSARFLVAAFGDAGHAFPAIALSRALADRGHEVVLESWERWRQPVEELGIEFLAAEEYQAFPPPPADGSSGPTAAGAARALVPTIEEMRPAVVISDVLTTAPALAAEVVGVKRATLVPHVWPEHAPGLPFFGFGLLPPRSRLGRRIWNTAEPVLESGLRRGRSELNEVRESLGLSPLARFHGGTSEELAIVATFPQLEYPRRWPAHVQITGPLLFELPGGEVVAVNAGDGGGSQVASSARTARLGTTDDGERNRTDHIPLVVVAPSTAKDPECELIRVSLAALADEPVRVVATTNRHSPEVPIELPSNATLVDWLSYRQAMPQASLVICHGGHGTVASALSCGTPVLVSPVDGDMAENGARVSWAGCGLMLPRRLTRAGTVRRAVRRVLGDERFVAHARDLSRWASANDGPGRACLEIERFTES